MKQSRQEAFEYVAAIPKGRVSSYGLIGRVIQNPVSGLFIGNWLGGLPEGLPWWRVAGADGTLKIFKKSPNLALEQRQKLEAEGVKFLGDSILKLYYLSETELIEHFEASQRCKLPTHE